jgi:hypothetical protein
MLEMLLIPTLVTPPVDHQFAWQNFTVAEIYFAPGKVLDRRSAAPDNTTQKPVEVKPSLDSGSAILNRLRTFRGWEKNWDGEGAAAPNAAAIETASNFLSLWSPRKTRPEIMLTHDGLPMFVISDSRLFGEIIVNSDETIDYFFEPSKSKPIGDEAVRYNSETVLSILKKLT